MKISSAYSTDKAYLNYLPHKSIWREEKNGIVEYDNFCLWVLYEFRVEVFLWKKLTNPKFQQYDIAYIIREKSY